MSYIIRNFTICSPSDGPLASSLNQGDMKKMIDANSSLTNIISFNTDSEFFNKSSACQLTALTLIGSWGISKTYKLRAMTGNISFLPLMNNISCDSIQSKTMDIEGSVGGSYDANEEKSETLIIQWQNISTNINIFGNNSAIPIGVQITLNNPDTGLLSKGLNFHLHNLHLKVDYTGACYIYFKDGETLLNENNTYYTVGSIPSQTIPEKNGYYFNGWKNIATQEVYTSTLPETDEYDVTYSAEWTPITYSVSYNSNGGSGSINNTTVTYDNYYSNNILAENTFTKFGYNFKEWNTKADGSGTGYASGSILSDNLTTIQNAVMPLYAIWKKKPLVMFDTIFSFIDWKRQGIIGNNATVSEGLITDVGFTLTSNTGVGEGTAASHYFPVTAGQSYKIDIDIEGNNWDVYIFFHNETSSGTGIDFNDRNNRYSSTDTNSSYQIFKAPDTATKAQIRVDANGSNNTVKFSNFRIYPSNYYHMNNSILANERTIMDNWNFPDNPLRSDVFDFIGWNTSPDGQGDNYDINSTFPENEDKILYSQWKKISYRAFAGNKLIKPAFLSKNKKIEKIFVGTTEV